MSNVYICVDLDRAKKYEFAGSVYEWLGHWHSDAKQWADCDFQFLANEGLVEEYIEPITDQVSRRPIAVKAQVGLNPGEMWSLTEPPLAIMLALSPIDSGVRALNIEITEICDDPQRE